MGRKQWSEVLSSDLAATEDLTTGALLNSSKRKVSEDLVTLPLGGMAE